MMVTLLESLNLILHSKGGLSRVLGSLGQAGPGYNSQKPSDVRRCDRLPLRRSLLSMAGLFKMTVYLTLHV